MTVTCSHEAEQEIGALEDTCYTNGICSNSSKNCTRMHFVFEWGGSKTHLESPEHSFLTVVGIFWREGA